MAKGLSATPLRALFEMSTTDNTRGHSLKIFRHFSRCNPRHYFFSERVVSRWNALPPEAVNTDSLNSFKNCLEKIRYTRMGFFMDDVR